MRSVVESKFESPVMRWAGVGPYYAMFPFAFAKAVIADHTRPGDIVLDPFAGRGTSIYAAATSNRHGLGIEINPVGYVYTQAKLRPVSSGRVMKRIREIAQNSWRYRKSARELPKFFHHCYSPTIQEFLLTARAWLDWRKSQIDCTVMALLLVHLHGKRTDSFSNQMRQAKSMSPQYAIRWWEKHKMCPPEVEPVQFMRKKIDWRYMKGTPSISDSRILLDDSEVRTRRLGKVMAALSEKSVSLLFTSPPYCGVTNYHYDQWLRLWLLGAANHPVAPAGPNSGKFVDRVRYRQLLETVFDNCAKYLKPKATIYVRTDSRKTTLDATVGALQSAFPNKSLRKYKRPFKRPTQTDLFGGDFTSPGEVDIIMR